jgi:hypothetical protein
MNVRGLMSREFMACHQFPRGIYEQVETGLHPSFRVTLLPSAVSSNAIHFTFMLLLVVVTVLPHTYTYTVYPCKDSRSHVVPACDIASSYYGRRLTLFGDFHFNSKY